MLLEKFSEKRSRVGDIILPVNGSRGSMLLRSVAMVAVSHFAALLEAHFCPVICRVALYSAHPIII